MMQKFYLAVFTVIVLCSMNLSQAQPEDKKPVTPLNGPQIEAKGAASIILTSTNAKLVGGEPVKLTIDLKNNGKKAFNILPVDVEWFYQIEVVGPNGKVLPYKKPRRSIYKAMTGTNRNHQMVDEEPISAGTTKKAVVWLSNLFDMTAPGDYKINVKTTFLVGADKEIVDIKAEQLLISISPSPLSEWVY